MHNKFVGYGRMVVISFMVTLVSVPVVAEEMKHSMLNGKATTLELSISNDGKSIVDQNGKEVARFNEGMTVRPAKADTMKMQGCMCCEPSCVVYEGERCIKWVRSCTWDFDCNCKK